MKMSRKITLKLLAGLTLTGCLAAAGCGKTEEPDAVSTEAEEPVDTNWYDEDGNVIPQEWKTDESGNRVLDAEGRPVPAHGVPRDRHGHLWVYHSGVWVPPIVVFGPTYRSGPVYGGGPVRSGGMFGGSGYRTPNTAVPYRAPSGTGSAPIRSATPSRPSGPSSPPAGSSVSRSGFGSTGSSASSSAGS